MSDMTVTLSTLIFEDMCFRITDLEAKLQKAAEALKDLADCVEDGCFCSEMQMATAIDIARATLAELKGNNT